MKKIIALMLALLMLFSFAACSEYEGGARYKSLEPYTNKSAAALSNVLKKTQIPTKVRYKAPNKNYDPTKAAGYGNCPDTWVTKFGFCSLSELAEFEESTNFACIKYAVANTNTNVVPEKANYTVYTKICYYFATNDFEELADILKAYVAEYTPDESLEYVKGSCCETKRMKVERDIDGRLFISLSY